MVGKWGTLALGACLVSCVGQKVFICHADEDCTYGTVSGVCQDGGLCSFPDTECPSGQRYGEYAGTASRECVPVDGAASGSGGAVSNTLPSTVSSASASGDPTQTSASSMSETGATGMVTDTEPGTAEGTTQIVDPPPDLIFWFDFDDAQDILRDRSGNDYHGSCHPECPVAGIGQFNSGAAFNGNESFTIPFTDSLDEFTVTMWVKLSGEDPARNDLINKAVGTGQTFHLWADMTLGDAGFELYAHAGNETSSSGGVEIDAVAPMTWVHIAGRWDGELMGLWVNGVEESFGPPNSVEWDDSPVLVGALELVPGQPLDPLVGWVDDLRLYSRALQPDEIAAVMDGNEI